jgi:hypothetical protein
LSEVKPLKKLEGYAIIAGQMERDELDLNKISEKYGNNVKQLANWVKSLTNTDYGYKYLKKEGYSDEQIGNWVRKTPYEKSKKSKKKSSTENNIEELLKDGENVENVIEDSKTQIEDVEKIENEIEEIENDTLTIPKPLLSKGTVSSNSSLRRSSTFESSISDVNDALRQSSTQSSIANLSSEQLTALGIFRDGNGRYFHASDTEDGGFHLTPVTQESLAGAVAGAQRQAQQVQQLTQQTQQTQQNEQDALMKKISENAVDQFQVNIQAIVRKVALSLTVYMGFTYLQGTIKHLYVHIIQ